MFSEHLKRTQLQLGNELIKCFVAAELCQFLSFCCTSNYDCTVLSLFDAQTGHKFPPLFFFFLQISPVPFHHSMHMPHHSSLCPSSPSLLICLSSTGRPGLQWRTVLSSWLCCKYLHRCMSLAV